VYYPLPLHRQRCFDYLGYREGALPVAEAAARRVLALPIYPELGEAQRAYVVSCIRSFFGA
jgi:dTDP-4-amino-4,6-dideoxygalactose transaminase